MQRKQLIAFLFFVSMLSAQTNINIGTTVIQSGVKRIGINLDGHNYYDKEILKNLVMNNPGFSPTLFHSTVACASGTTTTCVDANPYTGWLNGFWQPGSTIQVISGAAIGCSTTLASYTGPSAGVGGTYTFATPCAATINPGDWFIINQTIGPGNSANSATTLAAWWPTTSGNGTNTLESTDLPSGTSSLQAVEMVAPTASDSASMSQFFDTLAGHSFVNLNGTFQIQFAAKGKSGSQIMNVAFSRGGTYYLATTPISLTGTWANYTANFTASETGSQSGQCQLMFSTSGADDVLLDNVQLLQLNTNASNPTVFRDAVVTTLQTLKPGVIRMWDGSGLGNTLDNMLVDQFGRMPANFSAYPLAPPSQYAYNSSSYSIPDFLQLVQTVGGAEAWIVVPITFTPTEASNLIDYLSGGAATIYGAKRIAQGFVTPWTQVIPKIHLEFGNEAWNSTFQGGAINNFGSVSTGNTVYARRAQVIFAAMKANANFDAAHTLLVLGAQFANSNSLQTIQNNCNNNDELDVAPYMMNSPTDASSNQAIWGPALTEPQAYYSGTKGVAAENFGAATISSSYFSVGGVTGTQYGGGMYLDILAEANSTNPKPVVIYEENFSTTSGTYTQAQLNAFSSAWGAGLSTIEEELLGIQHGVLTQNIFSLDQYQFKTAINSETAFLWGTVIDMGGPTNRKRPQFLAAQVANAAIHPGGTMLQTTQTGTPTYTQSLLNSVAMVNSNLVQSFAFTNGSSYSLILLNTGVTGTQAVTFSGPNAPPNDATVNQTVLTSANLSDTNESASVIAPVTTTLTNFNPSVGITLAPFSETVLTWGAGTVATPTISLAPGSLSFGGVKVGTASVTQTIVLNNSTASSLAIFNIATTGPNFRDFTLTNNCGTQLPASSSCNINVTFTPAAVGTRSAILSIADSASGSPQKAALTGTGVGGGGISYYVSPSGNDSNSGTSPGSPWLTVAQVNSVTFNPGDSILFQAGGVWREQLLANISGASGNPITYGSYGSGAQPIIDAANLATWTNVGGNIWSTPATTNPLFPNFGGAPGIQESSQASLTSSSEWYWDGAGTLYVYSTSDPSSIVEIPSRPYSVYSNYGVNNINVQNLDIRGAQNYGLQCYAQTTGCSNWSLIGNTVDLNYSNGAYILTGTAGDQSINGLVQNNTFKSNGSSGFKIGGYWASWNVNGNQIYSNCLQPGSGSENTFCGGIYLYSASGTDGAGSVVSRNTVFNNGLPAQTNGAYGQGIWADTTSAVTISNNIAYGNQANGIYLEKTVNHVVYGNVGYSNANATYTGCLILAAGQGHNSTGNLVYQNTCSDGYWTFGLNFEDSSGSMSANIVQNNIFLNSGQAVVYGASQVNNTTNGSGNVLTHNSFGVPYSNFICWVSGCWSTYSDFEAAYGGSTNSLQQSPGVLNASSNNFNLSANSAARGFGAAYSGFPTLCGTNPDLGALPYPCSLTAPAGGSITLTSATPVTWSLSGPGTLSSTSGTSTTYTAPAGVIPQNQMLGCPVLPNDSIFNTPVNALPVDPNSTTKIASMNASAINFAPSWGISYADSTTPTRSFLTYSGQQAISVPYPSGVNLKRENGNFLGVTNNTLTHHLMTVQKSSCQFYESLNDYLSGKTQTCADGVTTGCNVQSAQTYPATSYTQTSSSVDAAGLLLAPLVLHLDEIKSGVINHAVRFSMGGEQYPGFVWPATGASGGNSACTAITCVNQGDRLRLKTSFNISTFSPAAQVILTALQTYGMIQADNGSPNVIQTATDVAEDPVILAALQEIHAANIAPSNFEVVDETMLQASANSYQVCPYNQACGFAQYSNSANSYVTPLNQAVITGGGSSTAVAIQPVAVGSNLPPEFPVVAGSYTLNLGSHTWVNPSNVKQGLTWTELSSTCTGDSINSAGVYTPPSSVSSACSTTVQGVSSADNAAVINLYLKILPSASNAVRIDSGANSPTTDANGNVWQSDTGAEGAWLQNVSDSPNWSTSNPLRTVYQSDIYNYGNDIRYEAIALPNGNYKVHLLYGFLRNGGCTEPCATWPGSGFSASQWSPESIEINGTIMQRHFNWGYQSGYLYQAPADIWVEAQVTNNILEIGSLLFAPDNGPTYTGPNFGSSAAKYNSLNGVEIIPDTTTTPGIGIDLGVPSLNTCGTLPAQNNQICPGTSNQPMNAIPILLSNFNPSATTWSIVSDPTGLCSITSTNGIATLSMANGTPLSGQPIVIKATNGTYSATATVYSLGSRYMITSR